MTFPKQPWSISFAAFVNALSIPLIALLLWWTLDRILTPSAWCPALEEFKLTKDAAVAALRCQPVLIAQLDIGKYVAVGLVGALSLSHLVSVVREAKAGFELQSKLGNLRIGGDAEPTPVTVVNAPDAPVPVESQESTP